MYNTYRVGFALFVLGGGFVLSLMANSVEEEVVSKVGNEEQLLTDHSLRERRDIHRSGLKIGRDIKRNEHGTRRAQLGFFTEFYCKGLRGWLNRNKDKFPRYKHQDCQEVQRSEQKRYGNGRVRSGVYTIRPKGGKQIKVYCDMKTTGGGWTVFQHRYDGSIDFYRSWADYKTGFGNLHKEFWLDSGAKRTSSVAVKMKVTELLGVLCAFSVGLKTCYGELTDENNGGNCEHEKQGLREADQDIKIANLVNTVMAQNVKIANLESTIIAQNAKITYPESSIAAQNVKIANLETAVIAQSTEFEKLVNQVLERRISQITSDYRFHERLQQEIEHRKHLNESQNVLAENMKASETNHSTRIDELKATQSTLREKMEMCFEKQSLLESGIQNIVKNEANHSMITNELKDTQSALREKMEMCFEKQSVLESDIQKIVNETAELGIQLLEINETQIRAITNFKRSLKIRDCQDVQNEGNSVSGVYDICVQGLRLISAYCDMDTDGGGWTVFQHRYDGSVDFYRSWADYKTGFGNQHGEFWLGNDNIHRITEQGNYKLRIMMEDFSGNKRYAEYSSFSVADENNKYRLSIGSYSGIAGDSLSYQNGMMFSTKDSDNDIDSGKCSSTWKGAWWYKSCHYSNLNGLYIRSKTNNEQYNTWNHWPGGRTNMKSTTMMMRKI